MFESLQIDNKKENIKIPKIMGILNTTPDSFSDGGQFNELKTALSHAKSMIDDGADIIDIGGESTRPGAAIVSESDELDRVIPIITEIRKFSDISISIDTSKPEVMRQAIESGATMINDVFALQKEGALATASELNVPVCLMHMQGDPKTMQEAPSYEDIINEVKQFLRKRMFECQSHGIHQNNIIVDPGFGFGKTVEQNYHMLSHLAEFKQLNAQLLVGISRKSMLGAVTDTPVEKRLAPSLSAAVIAAFKGADILRVHDVLETQQALTILKQL